MKVDIFVKKLWNPKIQNIHSDRIPKFYFFDVITFAANTLIFTMKQSFFGYQIKDVFYVTPNAILTILFLVLIKLIGRRLILKTLNSIQIGNLGPETSLQIFILNGFFYLAKSF